MAGRTNKKIGPQKKAGIKGNAGVKSSSAAETSTLLNSEKLKGLYASMLKIRIFRQKLFSSSLAKQSSAARTAEAIEVGAAFDLTPRDIIAPGPRQATLQFVTGVPPRKPISIAKVSPDAATASAQIGIATGLALAAPPQDKSRVTIALTASLALTDETWKATMKFAAAEKIAIIYLVETGSGKENNQLFRMAAQQCGLPAITVDGDDAVAVYRVMQECMRRARQGHGPAVLECITGNTDPLRFMEGYLKKRNLWSDQWKHSVAATAARDLAKTSRLYAK